MSNQADETREYIEFIVQLVEEAQEAIEVADDKMKQAKNQTFILSGSSSDDTSMFIGASMETNHDEIHRIRGRLKKIREKLDEWWRAV